MRSVIVTGTDTGIGKTVLSALLMASIPEYRYWKPVQSGLDSETDSETVRRLSNADFRRILSERYLLTQPLSPHASAYLDGVTIDRAAFEPPPAPLVIEGAGGVLVPLNADTLYIDIFKQWKLPVLLACRSGLGTINHTLLSLEALRKREIEVIGVVPIGEPNASNERAIAEYGKIEIVGRIPLLNTLTATALREVFDMHFDTLRTRLGIASSQIPSERAHV